MIKTTHLPITIAEAQSRGWDQLDVIFVSGDAYIDHPAFGVPLLARLLEKNGYRVGIIPQPDWKNPEAFKALGRPGLFFAVTAGAMDSMVAHYTPAGKIRRDDAYTPGNVHGARPNRATMVYTSCCKAAFKDVPVVIGGIEASLRRFAQYDFWEDKVRRSILFDSKADILVYGMGESQILAIADRLKRGEAASEIVDIRGTAVISRSAGDVEKVVTLPPFEEVVSDKASYAESFRLMANEQNPYGGKTLAQKHGDRWLIANPPALPLPAAELDRVYALPFTRLPHPSYQEPIPAWEQIKSSITTHRGCSGGCAFCAITSHQGKFIQSRSEGSIIREIESIAAEKWCKGSISDIGGPTANMYGMQCRAQDKGASCRRSSCLFPSICKNLHAGAKEGARLLARVRAVKGVRHTAVSSGIRFDLLLRQPEYFDELVSHHVGGLLKVAPEHLCDHVVKVMRKPGGALFEEFLRLFREKSRSAGKRYGIVPYLISGHPGCTVSDMVDLALKLKELGLKVEQVQDFTPTPGTLATCIWHSGIDPFSKEQVHVPKGAKEKRLQKALLLSHLPESRKDILEALKVCGRERDAAALLSTHPLAKSGSAAPQARRRG